MTTYVLLEGNPMKPCGTDLIFADDLLDVGDPVPDGWVVIDGNSFSSRIVRVAYRHEFKEADQ